MSGLKRYISFKTLQIYGLFSNNKILLHHLVQEIVNL